MRPHHETTLQFLCQTPEWCPPILERGLRDANNHNTDTLVSDIRVVVGIEDKLSGTIIADGYSQVGTETQSSVTLDVEQAERLRAFFAYWFAGSTILASAIPTFRETPVYNCFGFAGYVAGWTARALSGAPEPHTLRSNGNARLNPGVSYVLHDEEEGSIEPYPHAVLGMDSSTECASVLGYDGPLVVAPTRLLLRYYGAHSIDTVALP